MNLSCKINKDTNLPLPLFPGYYMKLIFPLLLVALIIVSSCTNDEPLPGGYELLNRQEKSEMIVTTLKATEFATYWKTPVAGDRPTILFGSYENIKSFAAFRFYVFSSTVLDTPSVHSAKLKLYQRTSYNFNADSIQASVYAINDNTSWAESSVIMDSLQNNYDETISYGSFAVGPDSGKYVEYTIHPDVVNKWVGGTVNPGIILTFDHANFMSEFYSNDTVTDSLRPFLNVIFTSKAGEIDTVDLAVVSDASLIQYNGEIPEYELQENPDRLRVGSATGYRSLVKFDVSSIPDVANIHNALLEFKVDEFESETKDSEMQISAVPVEDSLWVPVDMDLEQLSGVANAYASSSVDFFNFSEASANSVVNSYFQFWVAGNLTNSGLALITSQPGINPSYMSFFTGVGDSTLTPTVRITYSLPPSARFETP